MVVVQVTGDLNVVPWRVRRIYADEHETEVVDLQCCKGKGQEWRRATPMKTVMERLQPVWPWAGQR